MQKLLCVVFIVCVFCVSLAISSVFCISLAIFCSNPLQKPRVCCRESTVPCLPFSVYSTIFCLLSSLSGVSAFALFGVDPLLSAISPQVHTFLSGVCCCLLLGGLFSVCCQESYFCVVLSQLLESAMFCQMEGGGGPTLCVWRGDEHLCRF